MKFTVKECESRAVLEDYIRGNPGDWIDIGKTGESQNKFYIITTGTEMRPVKFAVRMRNTGIGPMALMFKKNEIVAIIHDEFLSFVDLINGSALSTEKQEGVCYEFIDLRNRNIMIVVHELGLAAYSINGKRIWSVSMPDIVDGWEMESDDTLTVSSSDGKVKSVCIRNGVAVNI